MQFFAQCNERLKVSPLVVWPKSWADLPDDWTSQQKSLLQAYDKRLAQVYGTPPAFVSEVGPVIGTHVGPGLLGCGGLPQRYLDG